MNKILLISLFSFLFSLNSFSVTDSKKFICISNYDYLTIRGNITPTMISANILGIKYGKSFIDVKNIIYKKQSNIYFIDTAKLDRSLRKNNRFLVPYYINIDKPQDTPFWIKDIDVSDESSGANYSLHSVNLKCKVLN